MPPATEVIQVAPPRVEARLVVDAKGQIHEANLALHSLLGYQPGTLLGLSLAWIMPPSQHTLLGDLKRAFHDAGRTRLSGTLMPEDGTLLPVIMIAEPCMVAGGRRLALWVEPDEPTTVSPRSSRTRPRPAQPASAPRSNPPSIPAIASVGPRAPASSSPPHVRDARGSPAEFIESLAACRELLRWLDAQLQHQNTGGIPRNGPLAAVVLDEASALLDQCRTALRALRETTDSGVRSPQDR